jgi:small subunit ribosomal protein S28e
MAAPKKEASKPDRSPRKSSKEGPREGHSAEIVEIRTKTGVYGEIYQVLCKVLNGPDSGRVILRNIKGPVKKGMIVVLLDTDREAKEIKAR